MKIILAPDKFKGSLTGIEFCNTVEKVIEGNNPKIEILKLPLADGGDGTSEVINYYLKGKTITTEVNNPFFNKISASYLYSESSNTAFIEMANASGLQCITPSDFNCKEATSYGTGELIENAIKAGATTIILGIGGSATNDCGIGMASALGYRFLDINNDEVIPIGRNLSNIKHIDTSKVIKEIKHINFKIACDVINPLYGSNGAAYIYAAQKGARIADIKMLDKGLRDFSKVLKRVFLIDVQAIEGAGAAGGMGAGALTFLNGELISGIELIKTIAQFDKKIKNANWIITGEGKLDSQTLSGKAISGVVTSAKRHNISVAAFCGDISLNSKELNAIGITYSASVMEKAKNFKDALENTKTYIKEITKDFLKEL